MRSVVVAPLLALALVVATAGPAAAVDTTITNEHPKQDERILPGDVTFTFSTGEGGTTGYECQLNDAGAWVACNGGTITYPDLTPGAYVFRVKGTVLGQTDPTPAERSFIVRNVPCEQATAAWNSARNGFFKYHTQRGYKKEALQRARDAGKVKKVQRLKRKIKALNKLIRKYRNAMEAAEAKQDQVC